MSGKRFIGIYAGGGRVAAVEARREGQGFKVLSSGSFLVEEGGLKGTLKEAVKTLGIRPGKAALSIPDASAKIAIMDFEELPSGKEAEEVIRIKASKTLNINPAGYRFRHSILSKNGGIKVLAVASGEDAVSGYEEALKEVGLEATSVSIHTFNLCNLIASTESGAAAAVIALIENNLSIAVFKEGVLDFYRSKTLKNDALSEINPTFLSYRGKSPDFKLRSFIVFDDKGGLAGMLKEKGMPAEAFQMDCVSANGARIDDVALLSAVGAGA